MDVVETLAYDFTAERNGGFRTFVPGGSDYEIVDFDGHRGRRPARPRARLRRPELRRPGAVVRQRRPRQGHRAPRLRAHLHASRTPSTCSLTSPSSTGSSSAQDFPPARARSSIDITIARRRHRPTGLRPRRPPRRHRAASATGRPRSRRQPRAASSSRRGSLPAAGDFTRRAERTTALDRILAEEGADSPTSANADAGASPGARARCHRRRGRRRRARRSATTPSRRARRPVRPTSHDLLDQAEDQADRRARRSTTPTCYFAISSPPRRSTTSSTGIEDERNARIGNVGGPVVAVAAPSLWSPGHLAEVGQGPRATRPTSASTGGSCPTSRRPSSPSIDDWGGVDSKAFASDARRPRPAGLADDQPRGRRPPVHPVAARPRRARCATTRPRRCGGSSTTGGPPSPRTSSTDEAKDDRIGVGGLDVGLPVAGEGRLRRPAATRRSRAACPWLLHVLLVLVRRRRRPSLAFVAQGVGRRRRRRRRRSSSSLLGIAAAAAAHREGRPQARRGRRASRSSSRTSRSSTTCPSATWRSTSATSSTPSPSASPTSSSPGCGCASPRSPTRHRASPPGTCTACIGAGLHGGGGLRPPRDLGSRRLASPATSRRPRRAPSARHRRRAAAAAASPAAAAAAAAAAAPAPGSRR